MGPKLNGRKIAKKSGHRVKDDASAIDDSHTQRDATTDNTNLDPSRGQEGSRRSPHPGIPNQSLPPPPAGARWEQLVANLDQPLVHLALQNEWLQQQTVRAARCLPLEEQNQMLREQVAALQRARERDLAEYEQCIEALEKENQELHQELSEVQDALARQALATENALERIAILEWTD